MAKKVVKKRPSKPTAKPVKTASMTIEVGKPVSKPPVTVFGIEFEQDGDTKFGKCVQIHNNQRVWAFMQWDGDYILWSRNPNDRYIDTLPTKAHHFTTNYRIVDFDTPMLTGAAPQYDGGVVAPVDVRW